MSEPIERVLASIAELPTVDQHCHSLVPDWSDLGDAGAPRWRRCFTEAQRAASLAADVPASTGYREFLRALSSYLGQKGKPFSGLEERVVKARAAAVAGDPDAFARRLFDDAHVSALLVDTGYGSPASTTDAFERMLGRPVRTIVRVESVAERCLAALPARTMTHVAFTDALVEALTSAVVAGAVGFKSIAAYRAGLHLPAPGAAQVSGALRRFDRPAQTRRLDDPVVVAHVVWTAARLAAERGLPLQFHVGFGDEDVHLPTADPTLLRPLFRDSRTESCRIVLLHNHPFIDGAAYLASIYPQVFVDLSLTIPLLGGAAAERAIRSALGLCPTSKLLAASDGHSYPEMHWWGMRLWRKALGRVLATEVKADRLSPDEVVPIARAILAGNATDLYGLAAQPT